MTGREQFVVDDEGLDLQQRQQYCRRVLEALAADAHEYETDIPVGGKGEWPAEVGRAAELLRSASVRRRPGNRDYAQTGVLTRDEETWQAFVIFAGWAFDATVWNADGVDVASLSDEGQALVLRLTPAQEDVVAAIVDRRRLVPIADWNARRRSSRRPSW